MPNPKDCVKFREYQLKQKLYMLLLFALNCKSRNYFCSIETKQKRSATLRHVCNTKEHRDLLSSIAKENNYGKWMKGRICTGVSESNTRRFKNKTYIEIYGGNAIIEAQKRKVGNLKHWEGKPRKFDDYPYQGGEAKYYYWRKSVFERDKYTCRLCGTVGAFLNAHHIKPWVSFPELRYELFNGMTLCAYPCHRIIHKQIKLTQLFLEQLRTHNDDQGGTITK